MKKDKVLESRVRSTIMDKQPITAKKIAYILKDPTVTAVQNAVVNLYIRGVIEKTGNHQKGVRTEWRIATPQEEP